MSLSCENMHKIVPISRKQRLFIRARLNAHSIIESARLAGISERQAHRWLNNPVFQEEYKRLETELYEVEQAAMKQAAIESIQRSWNERFNA
jgi:phage terminase small subunit